MNEKCLYERNGQACNQNLLFKLISKLSDKLFCVIMPKMYFQNRISNQYFNYRNNLYWKNKKSINWYGKNKKK